MEYIAVEVRIFVDFLGSMEMLTCSSRELHDCQPDRVSSSEHAVWEHGYLLWEDSGEYAAWLEEIFVDEE
ncbi:unnamed protein product [Aspergillus oryzae]|uniref:Unnamed protein product n=1 Tax=Aspergillus oryzae var. brunneus TaxID=332754 RepID=A0ABQ6KC11_ASPOZ|nr:unnamed protein product [Aspergillus oryzae]GMF93430.1 unnamed protein product [Aspergillus oryzae]GMG10443.1 unnamed protein product [Aspergillus oryzae]GMG42274.1 unnamed protein product [Aspergillus oryzae var. brunneus]